MASEIAVRTQIDLERMSKAGAIVGNALSLLRRKIEPGVTTMDLDGWARREITSSGGHPSFPQVVHPDLVTPFPGVICASVNEEVVHGIPSDRVLDDGDIVSIDVGVIYDGMHADGAATMPVGHVSGEAQELLDAGEEALARGIDRVHPGRGVYEISAAIDEYARSKQLGIVRQYVGHGIGAHMHEPPQVPNFRMHTRGPALKVGWTIAIEPMLNLGTGNTRVQPDGWTVATTDGSLSVHFEHTVAVTSAGHRILTLPGDSGNGNVR